MIHLKEVRDARQVHIQRRWLAVAGLTALTLSTAGFAGATPITAYGSAILDAGNGSVEVSGNGTSGGCIIWYNSTTPPADTCPATGSGSLTVQGGSTAPFVNGSPGTIQDLNYNVTLPLVDFITIANTGSPTPIDFDLKDIVFNGSTSVGDCTAPSDTTADVSCTPANSPFTITNGPVDPNTDMVDTVGISFTVDAYGYTGSSGTNYNAASLYTGTFTTQLTDATIASVLSTIESGNAVNASWSATFSPVATPEPASFIIFGAGLACIGLLKRRSRKI